MKGVVFDIKKYSVHDGHGIRSTVFLKGCPLRCAWCHNPESQNKQSQLIYYSDRCIYCKTCEDVCPENAIKLIDTIKLSDECTLCGTCVKECPVDALEIVGREMDAENVIAEIKKDEIFYMNSKGGVTFSGGEPFFQGEFLYELLKRSKKEGWHTTVDTCGHSNFSIMEKCNSLIDTYLYDLKIVNSEKHKQYTGVSNELILENVLKLNTIAKELIIRIPLIPEVNDSKEDLTEFLEFLKKLKVKRVDILPYHNFMIEKYVRLKMDYFLERDVTLAKERINVFVNKLESQGYQVEVGG